MTYELSFWGTISSKLFCCNVMHGIGKAKNLRLKKNPNNITMVLPAPCRVINYTVLWYVVLLPHTRHRDNYENHTFHLADL